MIRITGIKMPADSGIEDLKEKVLRLLNVESLISFRISKKSVDARKKTDVFLVYSVDIEVENEDRLLKNTRLKNISRIEKKVYEFPKSDKRIGRPLIVGTGPAGLFAGLVLARAGYKPLLIERGGNVDERAEKVQRFWNESILDEETNVQFGEGGAGTFSDGKLTTGIKDFRITKVLEEFVRFGANEEILYLSKPHIGTDILKGVVAGIREEIIRLGGEVRFNTRLEKINVEEEKVASVTVVLDGKEEQIEAEKVILAIGHSARDTFYMLKNIGVKMLPKPFSVGVRIEHPQSMIDKSQYGNFSRYLPAADYKLSHHLENGRGVYTFCMCPGGFVVNASSERNRIVTNGMSNFARNEENANSAVLISVTPSDFGEDDPLSGIEFQRQIEERAFNLAGKDYRVPVQTVGAFLENRIDENIGAVKPTIRPGYCFCKMTDIFPKFITDSLKEGLYAFDRKIPGFAESDAILTAPETRSSSPVTVIRDEKHCTNIQGLYIAGEGGGHGGGIMSCAVDGIKTAELILK